jgi:small GTP-binding protein
MPNDNVKIVVVGDAKVGKSQLVNRLTGSKEFNDIYFATIGLDFFAYKKDSMAFYIFDIAGNERFKSLRKYYYKSTSIIIYALDATENANKNKKILQDFQTEISTVYSLSNCFQLIVFTKSDDKNSNLSQDHDLNQDYLKEFNSLKFPIIVSSAKENTGFTEINKALSEFCSNQSSTTATKEKEESLVSAIEDYSKRLSKKNSQLAKSKSTALEAIAKVCRDVGVGQHPGQPNPGSLSEEQIFKIKKVIVENKTMISQHRHSFCFNWFFNMFDASRLAKRVTSNELVKKLDTYLNIRR